MVHFISLKHTYDPITTHGLGEKIINVAEIIHVTNLTSPPYKRIKTIKSRIQLSNGDIFDIKIPFAELSEKLEAFNHKS